VLHHLAQSSPVGTDGKRQFRPGEYFSIDRVFRNEDMDRTHLCEFHQVEGFVVDRNLSLANMMHLLNQFFRRIGIEQLRFKPAFNPYTEPSMEIFGFHSGLKKWMEVGNSGVFRPEMLRPMGFDDDVTAIAWGLSLERPTMIKYEVKNIHELFGHKVDLRFIKRAMIARY
jgi:phenylalanyl-tRNA synthetase alpha chain